MTVQARNLRGVVACPKNSARRVKNPARRADHADRSRRWFCDLLWRAFPGKSEREVAEVASVALGVSQRQVQNWLRCEHDASLRYVTAVMVMAGAEGVFDKIARRP